MPTSQATDRQLWNDLAFYVLVQAREDARTLALLPEGLFVTIDPARHRLLLAYDAPPLSIEIGMDVYGDILHHLSEKAMRLCGSQLAASIARKLHPEWP